MKKLLIVSLFLLSMIGLFAQAHMAVFDLTTEAGGYHETVGFKACTVMPIAFGGAEQWTPTSSMYWNWPEGGEGLNAAANVYLDGTDPSNPGRLLVQMAGFTTWGVDFGGGNVITANFYLVDSEGNEVGPYNLVKSTADQTVYPGVIAWGGPAGPVGPDAWATIGAPADAAMGIALDAQLTWTYEGTVVPDGYELIWNGGEAMDLGNVLTYDPDLAYETTYTWSIKPYVLDEAPSKGLKSRIEPPTNKIYPDLDDPMPVWSFTTEPAPIVYPNWATNATPENGATDVALMPTLTWTYDGPAVDGFEVWVDGNDMGDVTAGMEYTFTEDLAYGETYTWGVKPYIVPEMKKSSKAQRITPRRYPQEGNMNTTTFVVTNEEDVTVGDIEVTIEIPVNGTVTDPINIPVVPGTEVNGILINVGLASFHANIGQAGNGTYTFVFTFGWSDIVVYYGDNPVDPADYTFEGGVLTISIAFGDKGPTDLFAYDPNTLPVTLSSFTAVAHANEYVTLKWVTESESNLQGYNVYRAETDNQAQAIRINPTIVAPHNQTQTQTYTYTDNEVESTTYYYWLEVSELANENSFHGPIVVTVEDDPVVPGITETTFRNFGPSPFTTSTSTSLRVKEGETATVTIYNLLGQVVRRESFNAGEHNFEFNGRDANNKKVANGIYFVRMTSPTQTKNFKIVKIK